eukprot:Macronucleus_171.p1 GENE.Macronucleus_171~~Macronucleus_171.p1  ORF type:complete len:405 (+),score=195.34 Macronucleus_171:1-1215(+)
MDQHSFCDALGPEEGNAVLRDHWDTWITEDTFQQMADREVEIVRLPIGDWTLKPYGPYVGCTDGAKDKITWLLDTAQRYNIKVLLDVHAVKGSQNGFDNSGIGNRTIWTDENNFSHWEHAFGEWMGEWDNDSGSYKSINQDNINWAKDTIQGLLDTWGEHPAVYAIEPVNEPWWSSDLDTLKGFYRDVRAMIKEQQPRINFVFHDAFHFDANEWNSLFADDDMENVILDTHQYFAWFGQHEDIGTYCDDYGNIMKTAQAIKYPVWVGEWSLATDVCATWLGGFNDANTDASRECQRVDCPYSYLSEHAVDFDRNAEKLGPYGSSGLNRSHSTIQKGKCPIDSAYYSDDQVMRLGQCTLDIFNGTVEGHFMWTVRNELEPRWSYTSSYDMGWIKNKSENKPELIQ